MRMIDLYTSTTPNGRKISIMLEELGVEYQVHPIELSKREQYSEAFTKISPNNKIPAIVDRETGISLMESGAIMIYLADKYRRFLPEAGEPRYRVIEWLMWQMGGIGPMLGQAHQFLRYNKGVSDFAEKRYHQEAMRLYSVLNRRLEGREFVCGEYSIADMAIWPWVSRFEWQEIDLDDFSEVARWYLHIADRQAVQRGYDVPVFVNPIPRPDTGRQHADAGMVT
jgi:GST-like protein